MMRKYNRWVFVAVVGVLSLACSKDEEINLSPKISLVDLSPSSVSELDSGIAITIAYEDEDGDLGENSSGANNLFVQDSRNSVVYAYRIQQLAPSGATISIKGTLQIAIDPLVITDGSAKEEGVFIIHCIDRAGNKSNLLITSPFTVAE